MFNAEKRPWPVTNPTNFSKLVIKKNILTPEKARVIHMDVQGENNGESYKILPPRSPFIISHLERKFHVEFPEEHESIEEDEESEPESEPEQEQEPGPSTSTSSTSKKRESQGDVRLGEPSNHAEPDRKRRRQE